MTDKVVAEHMCGPSVPEAETVTILIQAYVDVDRRLYPMSCTIDGVRLRWLPMDAGYPMPPVNSLPAQIAFIEIAHQSGGSGSMKQRCIP